MLKPFFYVIAPAVLLGRFRSFWPFVFDSKLHRGQPDHRATGKLQRHPLDRTPELAFLIATSVSAATQSRARQRQGLLCRRAEGESVAVLAWAAICLPESTAVCGISFGSHWLLEVTPSFGFRREREWECHCLTLRALFSPLEHAVSVCEGVRGGAAPDATSAYIGARQPARPGVLGGATLLRGVWCVRGLNAPA